MRGTKLMAWPVPPLMRDDAMRHNPEPEGSDVPVAQRRMLEATRQTLAAIAEDARIGLLETVGVKSRLICDDKTSLAIELPEGTDTELMAKGVDAENVEAWRDDSGQLRVAIGPWYSTKDVDQVVLSVTKVVHVLLGLHAPKPQPTGPLQRWLDRG